MAILIALLRGVNVGGHNKLPMQALRSIAEAQGASDVSTYIQSGNIVFRSPKTSATSMAKKLRAAIHKDFGFKPDILMLDRDMLGAVIKSNPFTAISSDPSKLHVTFLMQPADKEQLKDVEALLSNDEQVKAVRSAIYFHAPAGIGRSKAAEKLGRVFPGGTGRNWRTCLKLKEMADALAQA
jgi:uncharacterized protein (DUF1697 family)